MPQLQFSSYIKQICVHSAVLRSGALEQQILLAKESISLLFLEGHCQRFLGTVAQQVKEAQKDPAGLCSQLLSGAWLGQSGGLW